MVKTTVRFYTETEVLLVLSLGLSSTRIDDDFCVIIKGWEKSRCRDRFGCSVDGQSSTPGFPTLSKFRCVKYRQIGLENF
ncbi:MAG: hypothetical protein RLY14_2919 [Planctomycetota bacterium]